MKAADGPAALPSRAADPVLSARQHAGPRAGAGTTTALPGPVSSPAQQTSIVEGEPGRAPWGRLVTGPWPLLCILAVQAVLSLRLVWSNTAFTDEALYLRSGQMEWAHLLHGTPIPPFPTYFSGAPVLYPPIGALADSLGGLAGARILSLCFMLGATSLLSDATSRLFGRRAAFFAAALFAMLGPTVRLGAFATYDAMSLFVIAAAAWCAVRAGRQRDAAGWAAAVGLLLLAASVIKYAAALFVPPVIALVFLMARPYPGGKAARMRTATAAICWTAGAIGLWELATIGNGYYVTGVVTTTLARPVSTATALSVLSGSWTWIGILTVMAVAGAIAALASRSAHASVVAALAAMALLVPLEQARIHTLTSLDKHVAFGAWFAAAAAGYGVNWLVTKFGRIPARSIATVTCALPLIFLAQRGLGQAREMFDWPDVTRLVAALRTEMPGTTGNVLIDSHSDAEYYLAPTTAWRRWSSTSSLILPSGRTVSSAIGTYSNPGIYIHFLSRGYFKLVELNTFARGSLGESIAAYLTLDPNYHIVATGPYGSGHFIIWQYRASAGAG